ncbi:MAG: adenylate/guanylate cyclase domain-containing protein [Spirochaetota bacterium]
MKDKLLNGLHFLFGNPKLNPIEHRLFNTISLTNGTINVIGSFATFYLPNAQTVFLVNFTSGLLFLLMYYLSRFRDMHWQLYWPFILTTVVFVLGNSILDGGSMGGTHYYFIPAIAIAVILAMKVRTGVQASILVIIATAALFGIEAFQNDWITPLNQKQRFEDVVGNLIFVQILTSALIIILEHNLNQERKKSDNLLLNILPLQIAEELKKMDSVEPQHYEHASVLFTDVKGFTGISEKMSVVELVKELDTMFRNFDKISKKYNIEKIKTIGDAYMAAGGIPEKNTSHPIDTILAGLEIQRFMRDMGAEEAASGLPEWEIRLGIHTGTIIAGVVGEQKFAYDIWGDTVNTASRMESSGSPGKVNVSAATKELASEFFSFEPRGKIQAKNKGEIEMFFVIGLLPELSQNQEGLVPNEAFHKLYAQKFPDSLGKKGW